MDSGNSSGSMQSSSGGDEEYDSRAESSSISAFLNNPQGHVVGPFTNSTTTSDEAPNSSSSHLNPLTHHTPMFDPLSSYLDPIQRSTTTLPNPMSLDMMWSKAGRSEPNQPDLGALMQLGGQSVAAFPTTQHSLPPQGVDSRGLLLDQQAHNNNNNNNNSNMVRNPKKRSRASRRAPTTVLTTDTTNFRAMVQEFTGIPAPPFTSSSPFPRTRLDLFGSATPPPSTLRSHLEPPYLLRPFAQKVQPFPQSTCSIPSSSFPLSSSSSSMVDTILVPNNNNSSNSRANLSSTNYQQVSSSVDHHLGLLKQHQQQQQVHMNSMHNNPFFSFQSILQAPQPRYPLGNNSPLHLASKTQPSLEIPQTSNIDSSLKVGVLEELGLSHAHVNTQVGGLHHQNMAHSSSDGALSRVKNNNNSSNMGRVTNNDGGDHGGGVILRSLSGSGNLYGGDIQERVSNGKVNYMVASPSDFHGEKGPECGVAAAARGEGMVESWINCSSD